MADDLNEILKHNPFTKELVDGWKETLAEIANQQNFTGAQGYRFILPCHKNADFVSRRKAGQHVFSTQYIPQPFIGHPSAPVWFLNQNPNPLDGDVCAMLNVSQSAQGGSGEYKQGIGNLKDLLKRQELMLKQLLLGDDVTFFSLDPLFDITSNGTSMFTWWRKHVCGNDPSKFPFYRDSLTSGNAQEMAKKLFVIEAFPYRSANWSDVKVEDWTKGDYFEFWKELVGYALMQSNKKIVVRGALISKVSEIARSEPRATVMKFRNSQQVWLSSGNITKVKLSSQQSLKGVGIKVSELEVNKTNSIQASQANTPQGNGLYRITDGDYAFAGSAKATVAMWHIMKTYVKLHPQSNWDDIGSLSKDLFGNCRVLKPLENGEHTKRTIDLPNGRTINVAVKDGGKEELQNICKFLHIDLKTT